MEISVNAWRSKSISLYGLWSYVNSETPSDIPEDSPFQAPTILPAIKNTFLFLSNYLPDDMEVYQPDKIEVWVADIESPSNQIETWPFDDLSLEYIINNSIADERFESCYFPFASSRKIVLEDANAQRVYDLFSMPLQSQVFTDGQNTVELFALPVLPNITDDAFQASDPISCTPNDGQAIWKP